VGQNTEVRQNTELEQYFSIVSDLQEAKRDGIPSITRYHLAELQAIHMHTKNDQLRRRCAKILAQHEEPTAVATGT
jgi:hypothetical protein